MAEKVRGTARGVEAVKERETRHSFPPHFHIISPTRGNSGA